MQHIDPADLVPLAKAVIPGNPHITTRWRWRTQGVRRHGQTIRLQTVSAGQRCYTTQAWVDEFVAACTGGSPPKHAEKVNRDSAQRLQIAGA